MDNIGVNGWQLLFLVVSGILFWTGMMFVAVRVGDAFNSKNSLERRIGIIIISILFTPIVALVLFPLVGLINMFYEATHSLWVIVPFAILYYVLSYSAVSSIQSGDKKGCSETRND